MTLIRRFGTWTSFVILAACSDPSGPGKARTIDRLPRQLSVAEQKLVAGNNAFAFELMRQVNSSAANANVFVSPLSASMALGMTANGSAGSTWEAMRSTLGLGSASREEIGEGYKSLIALLRDLDESTDFRIGNSIWYESSFPFEQSFLADSKSFFDAEIRGLDFRSPSSLGAINGWVSDATEKRIPKILDGLDGDEVMYLINAIYFKGNWRNRFDRGATAQAPFHALDGSVAQVPMMFRSGTQRTGGAPEYRAVELLYGNSAYAMTIVLPNEGVNVNDLLASMTQSRWEELVSSMSEYPQPLYLPRFSLTWEKTLNEDLIALGMGIAFNGNEADFSRISSRRLVISKVIQKTFLEVDEDGTEAAAATAVGMVPVSAPQPFRVDRPFLFAIRERYSGTILFMGKIAKLPG